MKKLTVCLVIAQCLCFAGIAEAKLTKEQARAVWNEVAQATGLTGLPFGFKETMTPNAWVTNGKSVTVTSGLLDLLEDEAELYGVLAHESGHVKLKHNASAVNRNLGSLIAVNALGLLFGSVAGNAASIGSSLANAGYSREQEIAADDYAVKLAFENHKDMSGLYRALLKLSKKKKTSPSGFNSHPPDERRLLHIRKTMKSLDSQAIISEAEEAVSPYDSNTLEKSAVEGEE